MVRNVIAEGMHNIDFGLAKGQIKGRAGAVRICIRSGRLRFRRTILSTSGLVTKREKPRSVHGHNEMCFFAVGRIAAKKRTIVRCGPQSRCTKPKGGKSRPYGRRRTRKFKKQKRSTTAMNASHGGTWIMFPEHVL